jgi:hypothetical protein
MTDGDLILRAIATKRPIGELIGHVLSVRAPTAGSAEPERIRAALNASYIAETAAAERGPADVAGLADALLSAGEEDLGALVLQVAAARQEPAELAEIARCLGSRDQAAALLRAVVRRRLPADITAVLCALADVGQDGIATQMLADLDGGRDSVWIVLELRSQRRDVLADLAVSTLATRLPPAELAGLALGLRRHEDPGSAAAALSAALDQEVGQAARVIGYLFSADVDFAYEALDIAMKSLAAADQLVLASLLEEVLDAEIASSIWARIIPGIDTFAEAFEAFARHAVPSAVQRALREAAKAHSIDRIVALVLQVNARRIENGVDSIFGAVVQYRPVEDIKQLANQLRDASWTGLAAQLLDLAIARVSERDGIEDAARLIGLLLERAEESAWRGRAARNDLKRWRQGIPGIIASVARRRDPGHLMGLVNGLVKSGRYADYRDCLGKAVAAEYTAADLACLPQVRGYEHLPVVLELMCAPLQNSVRVPPTDLPKVILALRKAGATDDYLHRLLVYVGYRRDLDFRDVISALDHVGLHDNGASVRTGHVSRVKGRWVRPPRFYHG